MMTTLLFTTSDMAGPRRADLERLLHSLAENARSGCGSIRSYLLLQNCTQEQLEQMRGVAPPCCDIQAIAGRTSLSAARNILLKSMSSTYTPDADDIIGFPDDDCWLPDHFVERVNALFEERRDLDVLVCRVSLDPDSGTFDAMAMKPATVSEIVRFSSSNNIFVRGSILTRVGLFDPALGVGTPNGGGEDTDFVIRASFEAAFVGLVDRPLVGHPEPDRDSAAKYFRGAFVVLARHARRRPSLRREFLRKILVGLYFVAKRKMTIASLGHSMAAAAAEVFHPPTAAVILPVRS